MISSLILYQDFFCMFLSTKATLWSKSLIAELLMILQLIKTLEENNLDSICQTTKRWILKSRDPSKPNGDLPYCSYLRPLSSDSKNEIRAMVKAHHNENRLPSMTVQCVFPYGTLVCHVEISKKIGHWQLQSHVILQRLISSLFFLAVFNHSMQSTMPYQITHVIPDHSCVVITLITHCPD